MTLNRREFVQLAAAMGASLAWGGSARASTTGWHERRDLYPEGVASGDPDPSSVILWTRRPFDPGAVAPGRGSPADVCSRWRLPRMMRSGGSSQRRPRRSQRNRIGRRACWSVISSLRASTGTASPMERGTVAASAGRSPRRWRTIHGRSISPSSAASASMKASSTAIAG